MKQTDRVLFASLCPPPLPCRHYHHHHCVPHQAVCELLSTAGGELEKGVKSKARLDAAFKHLERMSNAAKAYPARIRFVMKDLLELRAQHWVARRETFTVRRRRRRVVALLQCGGWLPACLLACLL